MKKLFKGFAVTSALSLALAFSIVPALAEWDGGCDDGCGWDFDNIIIKWVSQSNLANVSNSSSASSDTGSNSADGGNGGDVWDDGDGGLGGTGVVLTGVAQTTSSNETVVNANSDEETIDGCECDDTLKVVYVDQSNEANVSNTSSATSTTGDNSATGGNGGNVSDDGNGGDGGDAGVSTGSASAWSGSFTVANSNVVVMSL